MSYIYEDAEKLEGKPAVGNKQCVTLVKHYAGARAASLWREGLAVKGNMTLKPGTAIATFVEGKYQSNATGNHAAFYVSQNANGIIVVDQWSRSGTIQKRLLTFKGRAEKGRFIDPSNNGDAFSVIE